jgi:hypothetical protein
MILTDQQSAFLIENTTAQIDIITVITVKLVQGGTRIRRKLSQCEQIL